MFTNAKDAKTFLVNQLVAQAKRDGVNLSEIEEKMLYFSETDWTLPDIQKVSDAFERDCNEVEFEDKTAGLIRRFRAFASVQQPPNLLLWDEAVRFLRKGDHYLLVMVDIAASPLFNGYPREPPKVIGNRIVQLIVTGIVAFIALAAVLMVFMWFVW